MIEGQLDIYEVLDLINKEDTITLKPTMWSWLLSVLTACERSGDPDNPFYYLGGPMRNKPFFNFEEFDRVSSLLREKGYNIVSPAELDDPETRAQVFTSLDGSLTRIHEMAGTFLERDVVICAMPNCVGGIFLPGWELSSGANLESYVISSLGRPIYAYGEEQSQPHLTLIANREEAIRQAQMEAASLAFLASVASDKTPEDEAFEELSRRLGQ